MSKILINLAKKYEEEGNLVSAIETLKKALQAKPNDVIIQLELGNLCALNKQFVDAVGYFRISYTAFKDNLDIKNALCFSLSELGNDYQMQSKFSLAEACFEEVIQYEKNNWTYYYNLANAKDKLQKKDGAYQYYQKALSLNDQDADLWNNLGNVERELGRLDKAVASYERALTINPLLFHACLHLTHQKQHMCDWQGIEQLFQKICSIVKTNPESLISPFAFTSNPSVMIK